MLPVVWNRPTRDAMSLGGRVRTISRKPRRSKNERRHLRYRISLAGIGWRVTAIGAADQVATQLGTIGVRQWSPVAPGLSTGRLSVQERLQVCGSDPDR